MKSRNQAAGRTNARARRGTRSPLLRPVEPLEGRRLLSGGVVINEIHSDPDVKTDRVEFVELTNPGDAPVDLGGGSVGGGIDYTFPAGTTLAPGQFLVVAQSPAAVQQKFGYAGALGPFDGKLANEGETITVKDAAGNKLDEVTYGLGFPWPTVGDAPGYSLELINPTLENSLGGNWRSFTPGSAQTLFAAGSTWDYRKGTTEASNPTSAWRDPAFVEDQSWVRSATAPIGYDSTLPMGTSLPDMNGGYASVFLRKTFRVSDPASVRALRLEASYDDGFNVWVNGQFAKGDNVPGENLTVGDHANVAIEDAGFRTFTINPGLLRAGDNVIAVQFFNSSVGGSSDAFFDARLIADTGAGVGPTPGRPNAAFAANAAPAMRDLTVNPTQPAANQPVTISMRVTDPDGVASVGLSYQLVDAGNYIALEDAAYNNPANWTGVSMHDDGLNGDAAAGDGVYTVVLPPGLQVNRRLVRYRVTATDARGASITGPYADDPQPNFAYYVYNGTPAWTGSATPGAPAVTYGPSVLNSVPTYQLLTKRQDHVESQHLPGATTGAYGGDNYLWSGTLVYDGVVYDHVHYRARGGVWRYAMGKNMWKFDFNQGHDFQARDVYGNPYPVKWSKLNLGANIQQGDIGKRGEQGLFETLGFEMFDLAGVPASRTTPVQFRIVESASEFGDPSNQFDDDFQGMYLAVEQDNGKFLDGHDLPDGNFYKMEGGTGPGGGSLNNQGPTQPADNSDLVAFRNALANNPTDQWLRDNVDLDSYYSYHAIVEMIHHWDIGFGKNYFFYHNPDTNKWSVIPWDLDLTWYVNYEPGNGDRDPLTFITEREPFRTEYRNRVRELRDLLFNSGELGKLADTYAKLVNNTAAGPTLVEADRAMWDYNPILASGFVNPSKAGQGRYYQAGLGTKDFAGMVAQLKSWAAGRMTFIDDTQLTPADEAAAPLKRTVTYAGGDVGFPSNRLTFSTTVFVSGNLGGSFAAMEWRLADVTPVTGRPVNAELTPVWESGELSAFNASVTVPAAKVVPGHLYRLRVRMKDTNGRWGHWSNVAAGSTEFTVAAPTSPLANGLRVTELNYHPAPAPAGSGFNDEDFEFVELKNFGPAPLDLADAHFGNGITFTFGDVSLDPGEVGVVVKNLDAFRARYGPAARVLGAYGASGTSFSNGGEAVALLDKDEQVVQSFEYSDAWYPATDGGGATLVVASPAGNPDLNLASSWRASADPAGGSPGVDELAPRPSAAFVAGSNWAGPFNDYLASQNLGGAGGYLLSSSAGPGAPLPWVNLNQVTLQFDGPVQVEAGDLLVRGVQVARYGVQAFTYNAVARTATWTLSAPFGLDRVLLEVPSGAVLDAAGKPLAGFARRFDVVPGDANRSGGVTVTDVGAIKAKQGAVAAPDTPIPYSPFLDVNGSGGLTITDTGAAKARLGLSLGQVSGESVPTAVPLFSRTSIAASGAAAAADGPSLTEQLDESQQQQTATL